MVPSAREAIQAAFLSLLEERPLRDITVKDIVQSCGVNRNSFYYHFKDIPALLQEDSLSRVRVPGLTSMEISQAPPTL